MPGGKIAVYTGLVNKIKPTDDELAAVLGHEISHALREHARERVSQQMATNLGLQVLSIATDFKRRVGHGRQAQRRDVHTLPNSRTHETEADRMGVELAARGFDPRAAVTLWQKMGAADNGNAPPRTRSCLPTRRPPRASPTCRQRGKVLPLCRQSKGRAARWAGPPRVRPHAVRGAAPFETVFLPRCRGRLRRSNRSPW